MINTWSPLFSSIVVSTIWGEDSATRVVWITMLALKDKSGFVSGSVPGLARLAVVTQTECEKALKKFLSPDKHSKCTDNDGRRIAEVTGGWQILNHELYQQEMRTVSAKVGNARRQKKFRDKASGKSGPFGPLPGEVSYSKAVTNGASQEHLDSIVSNLLPQPWRKRENKASLATGDDATPLD